LIPDLTNIIGIIGATVALSSYLARTHLRLCFLVASGLMILAAHYQLLGASTTAVLCIFGAVRSLFGSWVSLQQERTRMALTVAGITLTLILTEITWLDWRSSISMLASLILVWGSFQLRDVQFRKSMLLVEVVLGINAAVLGSKPGVILAVCGFLLNFWVLVRDRMSPVLRS